MLLWAIEKAKIIIKKFLSELSPTQCGENVAKSVNKKIMLQDRNRKYDEHSMLDE